MKTSQETEQMCIRVGGRLWRGNFGEKRIYLKRHQFITLVDLDLSRLTMELMKALAISETYFDCIRKMFYTNSKIICDLLHGKGFPVSVALNESNKGINVSKEKTKSKGNTAINFNRQHYMELD